MPVPAPAYDRFATWPRAWARAALALAALLLVFAAIAPGYAPPPAAPPKVVSTDAAGVKHTEAEDDNDLRFYRLVIERVKRAITLAKPASAASCSPAGWMTRCSSSTARSRLIRAA